MMDIEQINATLAMVEHEDIITGFADAVREYEGGELVQGFAAAVEAAEG